MEMAGAGARAFECDNANEESVDFRCLFGYRVRAPTEDQMRFQDLEQKLATLMSLATDDREGLPPRLRHAGAAGSLGPLNIRYLRPAPGSRMALLRILMTNACSYNCHYCPMRRDRSMPRTLLKPEELVRIFLGAHRRGWCQGLFVTTGIPARPVKVDGRSHHGARASRERHRFAGYIHVKLVAGAETAQIERLTQLASRVSLNVEAPCGASLTAIAPEKSFAVTPAISNGFAIWSSRSAPSRRPASPTIRCIPEARSGMTVQFVVGATPDSDKTILDTSVRLSTGGGVHHTHFSAFRPFATRPWSRCPPPQQY